MSDLRAKVRAAWRRLRGGELTALRAALSVAVGLAIGVTPLYGAHILLVLLVCVPLRLDAPVAYLAANISVPVFAPFLTLAELEIGSCVLTGHALPLSLEAVRDHGAGLLVKELVAGTLVFSPAVATAGFALTYALVRLVKRQAPAPERAPYDLALDRVAARYASVGSRASYYYVRSKLAGDPVTRAVFDLATAEPFGDVLDAGCGRGQMGVLLLEQALAARVTGFDWDAKKVAFAARAAEGLPVTFEPGDLRAPLPATGDTTLLLDVLHYLTDAEQDAVLRNVARASRRRVLVRELDPDRGWRSTITRVQEAVTIGIGYNRGARVHVRPIAAATRVLEGEGFAVEVVPCWRGTPFANVLVVARRWPVD